MEQLETVIHGFGYGLVLMLESISMLCVFIGLVAAIYWALIHRPWHFSAIHNRMRVRFGGWLALALEFQLASDIVNTTLSATYPHLIQLGAVALIRTFLNYFLTKELKEEVEAEKEYNKTIESQKKTE